MLTPSELAAIKQGASPLAASLLSKYNPITSTTPCADQAATAPESIGHLGCFNTFDPFLDPQKNYYGRIDHNFGATNRLAVSLNFTRESQTVKYSGGYVTVGGIPNVNTNHNLSLVETHIFNPALLNESLRKAAYASKVVASNIVAAAKGMWAKKNASKNIARNLTAF